MPQFLILAAVGAGLYAGYRYLRGVGETIAEDVQRAQEELRARAAQAHEKNLGRLELDPKTGEYRPVQRD